MKQNIATTMNLCFFFFPIHRAMLNCNAVIPSLCYHFGISHFCYFEIINKNGHNSLFMITFIEFNNLVQKPIGAFFNLEVELDKSYSHVYNGISIAFWHKSDLCRNGSTVTIRRATHEALFGS